MQQLDAAIRRVCSAAVFLGGLTFILSAAYVTAEVLARKLFRISLGGANEISGYVLAVSAIWAFSFTLLERGHIRIDVVYRLLPPRVRAAIDILSMIAIAGYVAVLVWFSFGTFHFAWDLDTRSNTPLRVPQWIPIGLWYAGLILFLAVALFVAVRASLAFRRGQIEEVKRIAGTPEVDEEAAEFLAEAELAPPPADPEAKG